MFCRISSTLVQHQIEQNSTVTFETPREWQVIVEKFIIFQKG